MSSVSQQVSSTLTGTGSSPSSSSDLSSFSGFASSPTFASEVTTTTSVSDDGGDGMPSVSRSSSLLFGFLITFLALFVGFMACGYSSRRAAQVRSTRYVALLREMEGSHRPVQMKKPRLWDVWVDEPVRGDRWKDITPLSVSYIRPGDEKKPPAPSSAQVHNSTSPPPHETLRSQHDYLSPFILGSRAFARFNTPLPPPTPSRPRQASSSNPSPPASSNSSPPSRVVPVPPSRVRTPYRSHDRTAERSGGPSARNRHAEKEDDTKDTHAQISVIIAMPSPSSSSRLLSKPRGSDSTGGVVFEETRREELGNYEIGVARIPFTRSAGQSASSRPGRQCM